MKNLSANLERHLGAYTIAAGTTGVAMLAMAQPAQAEIVYTRTMTKIQGSYQLDLNNDGTVDFALWHSNTNNGSTVASFLLAYPNSNFNNGFVAVAHGRFQDAVALPKGAVIRKGDLFNNIIGPMAEHVEPPGTQHSTYWRGQWANNGQGLKNAYLGLRFQINGETHYGWARVSVVTGKGFDFNVWLTGYAYETIPGKGLPAGKMKGTDAPVQKGTLGHLARGAATNVR
jgi:hypothetical protein